MAKPIRFTPVKCEHGWRINVPAKVSETGKRQQLFYRTQKLALEASDKFKRQLELFGVQTRAISASMAEEAVAASSLLKPYGISLLDAARRVAAQEQSDRASVAVAVAADQYIQAKEGKSDRYRKAIGYMVRDLIDDFGGQTLSTLSDGEILEHLEKHTAGPVAFNQRLTLLKTFWKWAAGSTRRWCNPDALDFIDKEESQLGEIEVLSPSEAENLLRTAEKYSPESVIPFAISIFTGIRQGELARLTPADINAEGITVPKDKAKKARRRFIHMPEPLAAWLKAYPVKDCVCPPNWNRKEKAVRRLAGWRVWSDLAPNLPDSPTKKPEPPEDAPEWPQNAIRHTAASMTLALGKPLEVLIFEHGHSQGEAMLKQHYVGCMTKKDAAAIWTIGPKGEKLKLMKAV